jgi:hypothetical protein
MKFYKNFSLFDFNFELHETRVFLQKIKQIPRWVRIETSE